jgi:hypothetical protein
MSINSKPFKAKLADIVNLVTRYLMATRRCPDGLSWQPMQRGVNASTPFSRKGILRGTPPIQLPKDWRGFKINVPEVVSNTQTKLPLEITKGADLDCATPDTLNLLLAMGVNRQGGNAACVKNGMLEIFKARSN